MQITSVKFESTPARIAAFVGLVIAYCLLGILALKLATINNNSSPIFPAAGLAVGAILLFGNWAAPAILIGASLTAYFSDVPLLSASLIGLGNTMEAVLASFLIKKFNQKNYLLSYSEVVSLLFSAFASASLAASVGTLALIIPGIIGQENIFDSWYTWWSGDISGILMLTPLFLGIAQTGKPKTLTREEFRYGVLITSIILVVIYAVFIKDVNQAYIWILTPLFTFAGIKVGCIFSRILLIVASAYVIILTVLGHGPFEHGNMNRNLLYIQMLIASYSVAVLFAGPLDTKYKLRPRFIIAILTGWVALFTTIYFSSHFEKDQTLSDFQETVNSSITNLHNISRQYELFLEGQGSAFSVWTHLDDEKWNRYLDATYAESLTEILNSVGFIQIMDNKEAEAFARQHSVEIKTLEKDFAEKQKNKYIVTFHQPFNTANAKGWDLGSEPFRRSAADEALKTKSLVITDPLNLRRIGTENDGLLIFHPVFRSNGEFMGWNYISALNEIFFGKVFNPYSYLLNVKVFRNGHEVYSNVQNGQSPNSLKSTYHSQEDITLFQKNFRLEFYPTNLFYSRHTGYSAQLALLLNVFILFITGFFMQQLTFGQRAEELVEKRTQELEISKIQLVHSSKMASLGEMASGMAHEINNPLTIIQGKIKVISMLLEDLQVNDKQVFDEIDKIKLTTDRIGKIVKGLRTFSRVSEKDPFEYIPLEILIEETLDLCSERIKSEGIELRIDPIPNLLIKCRSGEISQVLINLLNNASDAIQGLDKKWIKIDFATMESRLVISITDSGDGIPDLIVHKIMDPFFTTKDVGKGTGLGLSISSGIIEDHGGILRVDKHSPNTRFIFDLEFKIT